MSVDANNPYAAPKAGIEKQIPEKTGIHRQGDLLVIPIGSELPDVCLKTGRRSQGKFFDKKLTWSPPWIAVFLLVNILVLLIAYLIAKKQGRLKYFLDVEVVNRMKKWSLLSWITFPLMALLVVVGIAQNIPVLIGFPFLIALVFGLVVLIAYPRLRIKKIDKTYIYLAKVHPDAMEHILTTAEA